MVKTLYSILHRSLDLTSNYKMFLNNYKIVKMKLKLILLFILVKWFHFITLFILNFLNDVVNHFAQANVIGKFTNTRVKI